MSLDPRANAPERIAAPAPLPHISRRALKRVKNPIPAPTDCRYCGDEVRLVCNSEIYNGRAALDAFIAGGMTEECAKQAITLIAQRKIPAIAITY